MYEWAENQDMTFSICIENSCVFSSYYLKANSWRKKKSFVEKGKADHCRFTR